MKWTWQHVCDCELTVYDEYHKKDVSSVQTYLCHKSTIIDIESGQVPGIDGIFQSDHLTRVEDPPVKGLGDTAHRLPWDTTYVTQSTRTMRKYQGWEVWSPYKLQRQIFSCRFSISSQLVHWTGVCHVSSQLIFFNLFYIRGKKPIRLERLIETKDKIVGIVHVMLYSGNIGWVVIGDVHLVASEAQIREANLRARSIVENRYLSYIVYSLNFCVSHTTGTSGTLTHALFTFSFFWK